MVSKKTVVKAIIEKVEKEYKNATIRTPLVEGYEKPVRIGFKGKAGEGYIPDVVLDRKDATELYCVELEQDYQVDKWRLFSLYSLKEKGNLHIVAPEAHLSKLKEALNKSNISARILYFN